MKRKTKKQASLSSLTVATTPSSDLNLVIQEAAKGLTKLLRFDRVCIHLMQEVMNELNLRASFEIESGYGSQIKDVAVSEGLVEKVAASGEMVIFEDVQTDPRYEQMSQSRATKKAGGKFFAVFPIQTKLKSWGALSCVSKRPKRLSVEKIDLLISVSKQIGIAIENATLYRHTTEKAKELSALYSIAGMSAQLWDINALLHQSMQKVLDIFGFTAARIYILDKEKHDIHLVAHEGFSQDVVPPRRYQLGEGLIGKVVKTGEPLTFHDMRNNPEYYRLAEKNTLLEGGFRGSLFIPITVRGEPLGVMNFLSKEAHPFSNNDANVINSVAYHLGIAIKNATLLSQLRQKTVDLEKANKAKNEFLSIMSHELRTPLNVIMGYTGLIREGMFGNLNQDLQRVIKKLSGQTESLLSMIDEILVATRIESRELKRNSKEFDLFEFFEQLRLANDRPLQNDLHLIWNIPRDLPPVTTDDEKLKHILQNLIDNAIKFTPKGSVTVSTTFLPVIQKIEIKVADTGIGIRREKIPEIFEMFRQVDSSETRPYGGVGLGLYIVKKFTDLLGGTVEVESESGQGSTFTIVVPCYPVDSEQTFLNQ